MRQRRYTVSGAVFQALLRNALAEPYVLGVTAGAGVGAALAIAVGLGTAPGVIELAALTGGRALLARTPSPDWRVFEITTRVRVLQPRGATRVWLPTPLAVAPYQKTMGDTYHPGGGSAVMRSGRWK